MSRDTMDEWDIEYQRAAYHEAGHGRAARRGGMDVGGMWAFPDGSGVTQWEERNSVLHAQLVAAVAGQEADARYLQEYHGYSRSAALQATHHGAGGDRAIFAQMAESTHYTFENLQPDARSLVRRDWYTIEKNAQRIAARGHMKGTWA